MKLFKLVYIFAAITLAAQASANQALVNAFKAGRAFSVEAKPSDLGVTGTNNLNSWYVIRSVKNGETEIYEFDYIPSPTGKYLATGTLRLKLVATKENSYELKLRRGVVLTRPDGQELVLKADRENRANTKSNPVLACLSIDGVCHPIMPYTADISADTNVDKILTDAIYSGAPLVFETTGISLAEIGTLADTRFKGAFVIQQLDSNGGQTITWPVNLPEHSYQYPSSNLRKYSQVSVWGKPFNISGGALRVYGYAGQIPPTMLVRGMYIAP